MVNKRRNIIFVQDRSRPLMAAIFQPYTHLIISCFNFNADGIIHLNNNPLSSREYKKFWLETACVRISGKKILMQIGGEAGNVTWRYILENREKAVQTVLNVIKTYNLDGIDLDWRNSSDCSYNPETMLTDFINELVSISHKTLIVTLSAGASDMCGEGSGPKDLCKKILTRTGRNISWFNVYFYNGLGSLKNPYYYQRIIENGYRPDKIVAVALTSSQGGEGYLPLKELVKTTSDLAQRYSKFGGIAGWEYIYTEGSFWSIRLFIAMNKWDK